MKHPDKPTSFKNVERAPFYLLRVLLMLGVTVLGPQLLATHYNIAIFGDSALLRQKDSVEPYPELLPPLLELAGIPANILNFGLAGSLTGPSEDPTLNRIPHAIERLYQQVLPAQPDMVVLQFGTLDAALLHPSLHAPSRLPPEQFEVNMSHILNILATKRIPVILLTPPPYHSQKTTLETERLLEFVQILRKLALAHEIPLLDLFASFRSHAALLETTPDTFLLDAIHPNSLGHKHIADRLAPLIAAHLKLPNPMPKGYTIPIVDIANLTRFQFTVDSNPEQYLGHPTTALLPDNQTLLCIYPQGHGRGPLLMKKSLDGGQTWSPHLPTPDNWATSLEAPTLYTLTDPLGIKRLFLFSGLYPARSAYSEDHGTTWSPLSPINDWGGIVLFSALTSIRTGPGHYMALFHDDGRYIQKGGARSDSMTLYKTFTRDGGLTWSFPEAFHSSDHLLLCEPGIVRSPDHSQLAVLLRENSRRRNSHLMLSNDEGLHWTHPTELPGALSGDRHQAIYVPDGRLFISFRDTTLNSPTRGDWVAWVGTYDDLLQRREGQYRVRLMKNHLAADCGSSSVVLQPDGTLIVTSYGHWQLNRTAYIVTLRFRIEDLDALAKGLFDGEPHGTGAEGTFVEGN